MDDKTVIIIDLALCFECGAVSEHMHHVVPEVRECLCVEAVTV